jgi:hypothetical protein
MTDDFNKISRREFTALSLATGVTAAAGAAAAGAVDMADTDVVVTTSSGSCDAALIHPSGKGQWPGVILFVDVFGLRPTMRDMAKRLAASGYTVLVPNPYYRTTKAPGLPMTLDFTSADDRAKIAKVREPLTDQAVMADATAYVKISRLTGHGPQESQDGRVRLLHGRPNDHASGRCESRPNRRRGVLPRRRVGDGQARQSASEGAADEGAILFRHRDER